MAEEFGIKHAVAVPLFISVAEDATGVDTATLCWCEDDANGPLQPQMHSHTLACDNGRDVISIRTAVNKEYMNYHT